MRGSFLIRSNAAVIALVVLPLLLIACGGSATPTTIAIAPVIGTGPAGSAVGVATASVVAPTPNAAAPSSVVVAASPSPLPATATAVSATGTALSATSSAFIGSATGTALSGAGSAVPASALSTAPPSDPQAKGVVEKARTRFDQVNTLHFVLTVAGDVFLDQLRTEKLKAADGDLVRPDRVSLTASVSVGPVNAQLKFIQIGDTGYATNILTGKWEQAPAGSAYDPRIVFDKNNGVSAIIGMAGGWTLVGNEKVNGSDTQHVRGTVPTASVNGLVASSLRGDTVDVEMYVEGKNGDVVRLILSEQPDAVTAGTTAAKWSLDLSKQNENIKVDAPSVGG